MTRRRGPALIYITTDGTTVPVDTEAVPDPRERDLYRALADRAAHLADKAHTRAPHRPLPLNRTTMTTPEPVTVPDRIRHFVGELMEHAPDLGALAAALSMVADDADREIHTLTQDRDLAIAHDRQPYPTAWAYEQACAALEKHRQRADSAEQQRDGAYRERAQLLALLATIYPAVIAPALDLNEPGWWIAYLTIGGRQASWHLSPRDAGLFRHVERVEPGSLRAQWDGHTTAEKYDRIADHIAHRDFVPPVHYVRSDGVDTCVHQVPVGPDSCWDCRDLANLTTTKEN